MKISRVLRLYIKYKLDSMSLNGTIYCNEIAQWRNSRKFCNVIRYIYPISILSKHGFVPNKV